MQDRGKNKTLTKMGLVNALFNNVGLNKREAKEVVDQFLGLIKRHLEQGHTTKLSSFGNFIVRQKSERPGRNPKTGEPVQVSSRRVVVFRPGQKLRNQLDRHA